MRLENHFFYNWRQQKLSKNLKSPVSRIVPKNVQGGTLWDFLNIHSVAKYQKIHDIQQLKNEKFEQSQIAEKRGKVS